jgi:UDP-2,3-diacylglucosamine pyrophosphatase LpxH
MPVAVVADAHLGGPGGGAQGLVVQLLALPEQGCVRLVLLGDLFHVWVGSSRFETPEIKTIIPALRQLRKGGIRIDYVEGNRDFFIGDSPYADLFDSVGSEVAFTADDKRYLAVHGDRLNDADWLYRFWSAVSKSRASRFFMTHLPHLVAHRLIHSTERGLAKTNFKHKTRIPEEMILRYAQRRLGEDYDVLLLGHFHETHQWSISEGSVWLIDAWFRSRRVEILGGDGGASN